MPIFINPTITIKQLGAVLVITKPRMLSRQLADIAAHATLGRVPMQDIDASADFYDPRASFEVRS